MKIQQTFEEIMTTVVQRKKKLVEKANENYEGKMRSLNKQLNEIEILIYQMRQYLEFTEKTIKSQSNTTVMCMRDSITERRKYLVEQFRQTKLTPLEPLPNKIEFRTLDSLIMMIKQLAKVPYSKSCSVKIDKTHKDSCQFTLTLKSAAGIPILGHAAFVNAMHSINNEPTIPLRVYDAGNGNYMFFNNRKAYCKKCSEPVAVEHINKSLQYCYCSHCNQHATIVWNRWVAVLINGKHVPGSPFK